MKNRIKVLIVALILILSISSLSVAGAEVANVNLPDEKTDAVRFENMLNNNYVYGEDFATFEGIVLSSELSLLNKAENGKLKNSQIYNFVYNMYGIDLTECAKLFNKEFNLDAKTVITPRGYTKYFHTFEKAEENADGTITVYTKVSEQFHDRATAQKKAVTVFVKNEKSAFGYNIFSSEIFVNE